MKSAIGDGMTRDDHADVSNQLVFLLYNELSFLFSRSFLACLDADI